MKVIYSLTAAAAVLALVACGGGGGSSTSTQSAQTVDRAVPVVINAVPPQ